MKRAFFSFDFDEDQTLKTSMVGQMKLPTSPFNGADWSMKEAAPQRNWEQEAESRITRSDVVVVLVGPNTYKAPGVLKEVEIVKGGTKLDQMAEENQTTWPLGRVSENGCAKGGVRMVERQRRGGRACCVRDDSCRRSAPGCGRDESADRAARQSAVRSRRSRSIR